MAIVNVVPTYTIILSGPEFRALRHILSGKPLCEEDQAMALVLGKRLAEGAAKNAGYLAGGLAKSAEKARKRLDMADRVLVREIEEEAENRKKLLRAARERSEGRNENG